MLLVGSFSTIALNAHHIQNYGMMNKTINSSHGGHRIFEDAFPFTKDQISRNHHGFAFIALSQEREEHLHFVTILLDIADIVENHTGEFVQFREGLGQTQISFRCEESLDKCTRWRPKHGITRIGKLISNRCQTMTFADSRFTNGDDISRRFQERSTLETLQLQLKRRGETTERESPKCFLHR